MAAGWFDEEGRANLPLSSLVGKVLRSLPPLPVRVGGRGRERGQGGEGFGEGGSA